MIHELKCKVDGKYTVSWFMSQKNVRYGGLNPFFFLPSWVHPKWTKLEAKSQT